MPNLRYTARGRPHNWQRRLSRVEYFGSIFDFAIFDLLATLLLALFGRTGFSWQDGICLG
jgi:hypothetical protein